MPKAHRKVWRMLAPLAIQQRTLTTENAHMFAVLCELDVKRAMLGAKVDAGELDWLRPYLQLTKQVESLAARFMLAPFGKPSTVDPKPMKANPWAAVKHR
jgi:hypothetical protein